MSVNKTFDVRTIIEHLKQKRWGGVCDPSIADRSSESYDQYTVPRATGNCELRCGICVGFSCVGPE